jgi:hypothetical protein
MERKRIAIFCTGRLITAPPLTGVAVTARPRFAQIDSDYQWNARLAHLIF